VRDDLDPARRGIESRIQGLGIEVLGDASDELTSRLLRVSESDLVLEVEIAVQPAHLRKLEEGCLRAFVDGRLDRGPCVRHRTELFGCSHEALLAPGDPDLLVELRLDRFLDGGDGFVAAHPADVDPGDPGPREDLPLVLVAIRGGRVGRESAGPDKDQSE
jgi:hypothetical protein